MNLKTLMVANAVLACVFGIGFVFAPSQAIQLYGNDPTPPLIYAMQLFGGALISLGVLTWFARNASDSDARRAIVLCLFVGTGIGFILSLMAELQGAVNALGWSSVILYLSLAIGFGYFQFAAQTATTAKKGPAKDVRVST